MKILKQNNDLSITFNTEQSFKSDAGWVENMQQFEDETLEKIINPIENYETVRYLHKPYDVSVDGISFEQSDIWFKFWFLSGNTYVQDYDAIGLSAKENYTIKPQFKESFFRLEFYKTPNNESPDRTNRRLVFAKNLSTTLGEKFYYSTINSLIYKPVFTGSNYRNKENMYLFWFQDDSAFNETNITGNTFWMSAKFFNAEDGSIVDFVNKNLSSGTTPTDGRVGTRATPVVFYQKGISGNEVTETEDLYYKVTIDRSDYTYQMNRGDLDCTLEGVAYKYMTGATPTATPITPTATPIGPTPVVPTSTPVIPTATPVVPTATPYVSNGSPTATPVVPTATPYVTNGSPTATPLTPTATPVVPTSTPYTTG